MTLSRLMRSASTALPILLLGSLSCDRWKQSESYAPAGNAAPPIPSVLSLPPVERPPLIDMQGRPMSFAPLVQHADPSVATVKAVVRGGEGLGTAFVYDSEGYLLTNHHVIEKAKEITVGFPDGRFFPARVVGSDKRTDIAVLKVESQDLPRLALGNSDEVLVGDWVVAIGNPFGLSHTVSAGILSAKGRTVDDVNGLDPTGYFDFLQTDASINPGNSGGPLLNLKGEVVGINTAIRANANSIGFAIPINMVKELLPTLLRDGGIQRSAIGVLVSDVSLEEARRLGRGERGGAIVSSVQQGGPGDRAGLKVDDVILSFNGKAVVGQNQLRWLASVAGIGQVAVLKVFRAGKEIELRVTLAELPDQPRP